MSHGPRTQTPFESAVRALADDWQKSYADLSPESKTTVRALGIGQQIWDVLNAKGRAKLAADFDSQNAPETKELRKRLWRLEADKATLLQMQVDDPVNLEARRLGLERIEREFQAEAHSAIDERHPADWRRWSRMPTAQLWELVALSKNLEPRPMALIERFVKVGESARHGTIEADCFERMHLADTHSQSGGTLAVATPHPNPFHQRHRLDEFAAWAMRLDVDIPAEMRALAVQHVASGTTKNTTPKPVQRQHAQDLAILAKLVELGYKPGALPRPPSGKPSVAKQAAKAALNYSTDVMNKAWLRLRVAGQIVDA